LDLHLSGAYTDKFGMGPGCFLPKTCPLSQKDLHCCTPDNVAAGPSGRHPAANLKKVLVFQWSMDTVPEFFAVELTGMRED
jgi:hypothetical protein